MSSRAAVGRVVGRGSQADSAVSKAPAGGAQGAMEARRPAAYVGLSARRTGARTGARGKGRACGPSACVVRMYDSFERYEAYRSAARLLRDVVYDLSERDT